MQDTQANGLSHIENMLYSLAIFNRIKDKKDKYFGEFDLVVIQKLQKEKTPCSYRRIKNILINSGYFTHDEGITRALHRLQRDGYIVNNPNFRRSNWSVTVPGKRLLIEIERDLRAAYDEANQIIQTRIAG
ncbi:MAG TPA: hypothetical protein VGZ90_13520 [Puia sp.]|jgi:hypothetical protein|nr:hypothetical protein [Puia sp.]